MTLKTAGIVYWESSINMMITKMYTNQLLVLAIGMTQIWQVTIVMFPAFIPRTILRDHWAKTVGNVIDSVYSELPLVGFISTQLELVLLILE